MKEEVHEDTTVKKEHTVPFLQFIVCKIISDCFQMQANMGYISKHDGQTNTLKNHSGFKRSLVSPQSPCTSIFVSFPRIRRVFWHAHGCSDLRWSSELQNYHPLKLTNKPGFMCETIYSTVYLSGPLQGQES